MRKKDKIMKQNSLQNIKFIHFTESQLDTEFPSKQSDNLQNIVVTNKLKKIEV